MGKFLGLFGWSSSEPSEKTPEGCSRQDIMTNFLNYTVDAIRPAMYDGEPISFFYISHEYPAGSELRDNTESFPFAGGVASRLWRRGTGRVRPYKITLKYERDGDDFVVRVVDIGNIQESVYAGSHNIIVDDFRRIDRLGNPFDNADKRTERTLDRLLIDSLTLYYAFPSPKPNCVDIYRALNIRALRSLRNRLGEKEPGINLRVETEELPSKYAGMFERADTLLAFAEQTDTWDDEMDQAFESIARDARRLSRSKPIRANLLRHGFRKKWKARRTRNRELRNKLYKGGG